MPSSANWNSGLFCEGPKPEAQDIFDNMPVECSGLVERNGSAGCNPAFIDFKLCNECCVACNQRIRCSVGCCTLHGAHYKYLPILSFDHDRQVS